MPFELSFTKRISVDDPEVYFNECCWGGDHVPDRLMPMIREHYESIQNNQQDWGWFIWFRDGGTKLAVDVFCDDKILGQFRVFLTSQVKRSLPGYRVADSDELGVLKMRVRKELESWADSSVSVALLDENHDPMEF
jgi:hypothetical protein